MQEKKASDVMLVLSLEFPSCRLSTVAFYGLFLTPMLIIVLFNSIVFGLVLRVIRKIYKTGNLLN